MVNYSKKSRSLLLLLGAATCPLVLAQIEVIEVTATKRIEEQHKVAITMQAIDAESIETLQIRTADQVLDHLANVGRNATNNVNAGFSIRGVGTNNWHGNVSRAIGIYVDDVSLSTPYSGVLSIFDMQQIEVLRGPQNTIFGRNSMGGAIHYITQKPQFSDESNGYVSVGLGQHGSQDLQTAVGFSLNDKIAARISLMQSKQDGVFVNQAPGREGELLGEKDQKAMRFQLLFGLQDDSEVRLSINWGENGGKGLGHKAVGLRDPTDVTRSCSFSEIVSGSRFDRRANCVTPLGDNPSFDDWHSIYDVSPVYQNIDTSGIALTYAKAFNLFDLDIISAIQSTDVQFSEDLSGGPTLVFVGYQDSQFRQVSHEVRLTSNYVADLSWMIGGYYFSEDTNQTTNIRRRIFANGAQITPHNILDQQENDITLYALLDFDLSETIRLSSGVRYIHNEKKADSHFGIASTPIERFAPSLFIDNEIVTQLTANNPGTCPQDGAPCVLDFNGLSLDANELVYEIKSRFQYSDDLYYYINLSTGFKSGGFDTRALAAFFGDASSSVAPESMKSAELGMKSWWFNRHLRFNSAMFYYKWQDLQTFDVVDGIPGFVNIPKVDISGIEIDFDWQLADETLLSANLGYLHSEIKDIGRLTSVDKGHSLQNTPPFSANVRITQGIPTTLGLLNISLESNFIDRQYDSLVFAEDVFTRKPSQLYLNAFAKLELNDNWTISAWAQNLTEENTCFQIDSLDNVFTASANDLAGILMCNPSIGVRQVGITLQTSW
jgi:iron complex outermembrane receptor protein